MPTTTRSSNKFKVLEMKDRSDDWVTRMDRIFDAPFRLLLIAKSGLGKTSLIGNIILRFYSHVFNGHDIYIFSPLKNDYKMETIILEKDIPDHNIFEEHDNDLLRELYDKLVEDFEERVANGKRPKNTLIIMDDLSFSGALRSGYFNQIARIFCNGRKQLISIIISSQLYSHVLPVCRENCSGMIVFNTAVRQLEQIAEDNNFLKTKRQFIEMFRANVREKHDFLVINYSNRLTDMYLNSDFEVIDAF